MERLTGEYCELALDCLHTATPIEYLNLAAVIIVVGWLATRIASR